ncbi:MAG: tetratricopeptide repeat protein [Methylocystis sp.]
MTSAPRALCVVLIAGLAAAAQGARAQALVDFPVVSPFEDAQDPSAEFDRLADEIRLDPTNYEKTYAFIRLATRLGYDEEAISALQRLLMFNPDLARARKELGYLYARLGADTSAAVQLKRALDEPNLDSAQKAQIEAQLPDIEEATKDKRLFGSLQIGIRSQSNANYFPAGGLFGVGGVQTTSLARQRSDANTFELAQGGIDWDFLGHGGPTLEMHGLIYATQQFKLPEYDVALFAGTAGPRFEIAPGLSVKPYITGAASVLGDVNYLNDGGAGITFRKNFGRDFSLEPGFEYRSLYVYNGGPQLWSIAAHTAATLASGDVYTGSLNVFYRFNDTVRLEGRGAYSRANAVVSSQSSDTIDLQAMLHFEFDPPLPEIPRRWTIAPYARFMQTAFDSPNFLVDPWRARRDDAWTYGAALDAPIGARWGFSGHLEYLRNDSNIQNFKMNDFSVVFGPVAKF